VDVLYVVTGRRVPALSASLSETEEEIVQCFRGMPEEERNTFLRVARSLVVAASIKN